MNILSSKYRAPIWNWVLRFVMGDVMGVLKQLEVDRPPHTSYAPPMPRQARLDAPGALHHVMARGIERVRIFRTETDQEDFLARLAALCQA